MPIGILFWVLMIIWAIFGFAWNSNPYDARLLGLVPKLVFAVRAVRHPWLA